MHDERWRAQAIADATARAAAFAADGGGLAHVTITCTRRARPGAPSRDPNRNCSNSSS
jgi:hypothetical protein